MMPIERRRRIGEDIEAQGTGQIKALSQKYDVSEMTIRRDLKALEEEGRVKCTHGGAVRLRKSSAEPRYAAKQKERAPQKRSIAKYTAEELVEDGDVIILEGGTTVTAMVRFLADRQDLTIVTNGLHTMNELQPLLSEHAVICCGGLLRDVSFTFVGPVAERFFREFHANKVFLSATGWTKEAGFTDPSMLETPVKKAMREAADEVILLLDSSKFGKRSLATVLQAEAMDVLITDEDTPVSTVQDLRAAGVDVRPVPLNARSTLKEGRKV